jgi:5-methylcytosine-specific restriction endonuclease McrA
VTKQDDLVPEYGPTKRCCGCSEVLPRERFYRNVSRPDGLQTVCKDCTKARNRAWHDANPDAHRRHYASYQLTAEQRDRRRRRAADWYAANREQARANSLRWRTSNLELARLIARRRAATRRARKLAAFVEVVDPMVVYDRDGGLCGLCGSSVDREDFHVDHIVPFAAGGEHSYANTQLAHARCNRVKGAKAPLQVAAAGRNRA